MSSPTLHQRGSRSPKTRGSKKRSSSGTFASLFATLTSFSSSNSSGGNTTAAPAAPAAAGKSHPVSTSYPSTPSSSISKSLPSTAHSNEPPAPFDMSRRRPGSKSGVPASKMQPETRIVARPSTAQKQVVKHVTTAPRTPSSAVATASAGKPDVFSFMSGEISTPPTPRPRGGLPRGLGITGDMPLERSAGGGHISAPTPRRPVMIPKSPSTVGSPSDSGLSSDSDDDDDEDDSGPDTPRPEDRRALIATSSRRSLERLQGQDAVGRSIRSEDYYRKVGRSTVTPPPEAPMAPNFQQPQQQQQHQQHQQHQQQQSLHLTQQHSPMHQQAPNYDYHFSSPAFGNFQDASGLGGLDGSFSVPYPTPPLESNGLPGLPSPKVPAAIDAPPASKDLIDSPAFGRNSGSAEALPRQYRILTQTTIKRTEVIIDNLEAELRSLDKAVPTWQREQLVMRLSNTLIMHHRLVDIWSKISQLSRLTMSRMEDRQKIEAVWSQLRQQYSHVSQVNGLGVDKFISNIVTDLVNVGERAQITAKADGERASGESPDTKIIMLLLGLILIFLLLRDEIFQKFFIVAGVIVGLYTLLQQNGSKNANTTGRREQE